MSSKNVTVVNEDATAMGFAAASFDAALSFTMLHHVPSAALQDRLLTEVARVLRQGGIFAGVDSRNSTRFRWLHIFDTMVLVTPPASQNACKPLALLTFRSMSTTTPFASAPGGLSRQDEKNLVSGMSQCSGLGV
jgi:ubiquinone/menaquinone biosynthesis C-methylase UbiE